MFDWKMFPFTSFNRVNLDWIFSTLKQLIEGQESVQEAAEEATEAAENAEAAASNASSAAAAATAAAQEAIETISGVEDDVAAAVATANEAKATAEGIEDKADLAIATADSAALTANAASATAGSVAGVAQNALTTAQAADATAAAASNAAAAAGADAIAALDDVAALSEVSNIKTYSSISQLNLSPGTATLAQVWSALPADSVLNIDASELLTTEIPSTSGSLTISKASSPSYEGRIAFFGKMSTIGNYEMFFDNLGNPDGVWIKEWQNDFYSNFHVEEVNQVMGSIASNNNIQQYFTLPTVSGFAPLGFSGFELKGSGFGYCYVTRMRLNRANGLGYVTVVNRGTNATGDITLTCYVLYCKR